ncbi:MAG: hypothetical protein RL204_1543 [Bacteroidota bacterium]|jgi:hypothetical protein
MFPFKITLVKKLNCKVTEIDLPIVMEMMEEFVAENDYREIVRDNQAIQFRSPIFMSEWGYKRWERYKRVTKGKLTIEIGENQSELHFEMRIIYPWIMAAIVALFFIAQENYFFAWGALVGLGLIQWLIFLSYQNGWKNELAHQIERMIKLKYDVARRESRINRHP